MAAEGNRKQKVATGETEEDTHRKRAGSVSEKMVYREGVGNERHHLYKRYLP